MDLNKNKNICLIIDDTNIILDTICSIPIINHIINRINTLHKTESIVYIKKNNESQKKYCLENNIPYLIENHDILTDISKFTCENVIVMEYTNIFIDCDIISSLINYSTQTKENIHLNDKLFNINIKNRSFSKENTLNWEQFCKINNYIDFDKYKHIDFSILNFNCNLKDDYQVMQNIFEHLYKNNNCFTFIDVVKYINEQIHPKNLFDSLLINNGNKLPVIITFSGFSTPLVKNKKCSNLIMHVLSMSFDEPRFEFTKFNKNNINYIYINDFTQSYSLISFQNIIEKITSYLNIIKPSHIILLGASSAASQCILYNNHIKPNLTLAFLPQIKLLKNGYHNSLKTNLYNKYCSFSKDTTSKYFNLEQAQPFLNKTNVFIQTNKLDNEQVNYLDRSDPLLSIIKISEKDNHGLIDLFSSKEEIYNFICSTIENELHIKLD